MKIITVNNEKFIAEADYKKLEKSKTKIIKGSQADIPFVIGGKYFFRTVTYFATGEVADIVGKFLVLKKAVEMAYEEIGQDMLEEGQTEQCKDVLAMNYLIGYNKGWNSALSLIEKKKSLFLDK